jgi:hypothetical protein
MDRLYPLPCLVCGRSPKDQLIELSELISELNELLAFLDSKGRLPTGGKLWQSREVGYCAPCAAAIFTPLKLPVDL